MKNFYGVIVYTLKDAVLRVDNFPRTDEKEALTEAQKSLTKMSVGSKATICMYQMGSQGSHIPAMILTRTEKSISLQRINK